MPCRTKEERNVAMRQATRRWEARNPEKVAAQRKRSYERHRADRIAKASAASAVQYARDPSRKLITNAAWRKSNTERMRELNRLWREQNRGRARANVRAYQVSKKKQMPVWADHEKIKDVYNEADRLSRLTGILHHVDHDIPLRGTAVSGLHVHYNLTVLPAKVNLQKGNRHVV